MSDGQRTRSQEPVLRLGISTCLLGEPVRCDGGHKRDRFPADILDKKELGGATREARQLPEAVQCGFACRHNGAANEAAPTG
jgi:hypothetical protein